MIAAARWLSRATIARRSSATIADVGAVGRPGCRSGSTTGGTARPRGRGAALPRRGWRGSSRRTAGSPHRASRHGMNGGRPQCWPRRLNTSGGAPTDTSRASDVLPRPGVEPVRVDADRQVVHDRDLAAPPRRVGARRAIAATRGTAPDRRVRRGSSRCRRRRAGDSRPASRAIAGRAARRGRTRPRTGAARPAGRRTSRSNSVPCAPARQIVSRTGRLIRQTESRSISRRCVERASGRRRALERDARVRRAGDVLDPQIQRVSIATAGREVRARLLGVRRGDRAHRVDEHEAGPQLRSTTAPTGRGRRDRRCPSCATSGSRTAGQPIPSHADRGAGDIGAG